MGWRRIWGASSGTATVEFIGLIPGLILVTLIAGQLMAAGFSLWSAALGARAAARAEHIGTDRERAARRALPALLRDRAEVRRKGSVVVTRVEVPRLIPGLPPLRVQAESGLGGGW